MRDVQPASASTAAKAGHSPAVTIKLSKPERISLLVVGGLIVCGLCGGLVQAINGSSNDGDSTVPAATATPPAPTTAEPALTAPPAATSASVAPRRTTKPTKVPRRTVQPEPEHEPPQPADVYYANCSEVRAAGAAPIRRGDPGYSRKLDRDGDGIACE